MPTTVNSHVLALSAWNHIPDPDRRSRTYFEAEMRLSRGLVAQSARAGRWATRLREYENFWASNGRSPRENTGAKATLTGEERRLGEWARYQRRFAESLSAYQRKRLDLSPAFEWDILEAHWQRQLKKCQHHLATKGELPSLKRNSTAEFQLARWLTREINDLRLKKQPAHRNHQLGQLLSTARDQKAGRRVA